MSAKSRNPYSRGLYQEAFDVMAKKQIVTRSQLVEFFVSKGKSEGAAKASVTVLLSPRLSSKNGDCRGNCSAMGHAYYMSPLKKVKGEEKRFRLFYRKEVLEKHTRADLKGGVEQEKTVKAKAVEVPVEA